ncbi:ABC transporter ATP-binding protein [Kurthia sibirica]|uniref:ABC transporter ATP-binding protein n=1 Tax=Kurthia sibirica TaxID=202750 RepID=A0A2U3ANX1_9BACL|nr:ABC transporter ATP-binding protein [Kurthia sibirica]PWI26209.1 ABC transporter ATP-binding protein [Kurthia sibirica]GEK34722.1 ABC transporter ATP-binding protein [Kurthia sibirica]
MLKIENVCKQFQGVKAVNELSFSVEKGQIFGVIGPNGAGKTTLFNLISGSFKPDSGAIYFNGRNSTKMKCYTLCKSGIGRTYQVVKPFASLSVLENVMVGAFNTITSKEDVLKYAMSILTKVGLQKKATYIGSSLTLAEKKRMEIARALATKPKLLLLDEVMAGLNTSEVKELLPLVLTLRDEGMTIVIIEHIMEVVMTICDHIVVINYGQKIAEGCPREVANHPEVIKAYFGEEMTIA